MNLHTLKNVPGAKHKSKRLGRGHASGKGKTSGKGHKGQYARKGHKVKHGFEGGQMPMYRRMPKRGFTSPFHKTYAPVNLATLDSAFEDGASVGPVELVDIGVAKGSSWAGVKILGVGEISKKLQVTAHRFSATARAKIEAAGGTCIELEEPASAE
jgi:large subunit ribosomal protein L15